MGGRSDDAKKENYSGAQPMHCSILEVAVFYLLILYTVHMRAPSPYICLLSKDITVVEIIVESIVCYEWEYLVVK